MSDFPLIYAVGVDQLSECDLERILEFDCHWAVYDYEDHGYDGSGMLYMWDGERLFEANLSHCSCYPPTDILIGDPNLISYLRGEVLNPDIHDCPIEEPCLSKITELLR